MIHFLPESKSFLLTGKGYSYAMYVNRVGMLQQLYYGRAVSGTDIDFLIEAHGRRTEPNSNSLSWELETSYMPSECGAFGRGDFRTPSVIAAREDGASMSLLKYFGHKIIDGASRLEGIPCARRADETLIVTLKDELSDMELDLYYSVSEDSGVLVRSLTVRNTGSRAMELKRAYSFNLDLPDIGSFYALRLPGDYARERRPDMTELSSGTLRVESAVGYSSHEMNPFLGIAVNGCDEEQGECYGFNLIYSGNFVLNADRSIRGCMRICGGINELGFSWRLNGGEEFTTPQVAMCYSSGGFGELSRSYHDFFREYIIDPRWASARRPIVANNWEATGFSYNSQKLFDIIDRAAGTGIDTFVLDDGWFGKRDDDTSGLGDWIVNEDKLQGGLSAVIDRCRKNGLKFGLWFEPEMISENSELYRAHPDWAVGKAGLEPCRGRNQLVLDITRPEVADHVFNAIADILSSYDISYVKWDKNRAMTEFFSSQLPPDRQGEFIHRYTLAFYGLAERLTGAFPDIFFEGCAGGGGRFDGGALYYFPQIWTSDETDALDRTQIQWGTSFCYPLSSMSCHVAACHNPQTCRVTPFATRGAIASLGATGYELDLTELTEDERRQIKTQIEAYKEIDELILRGELYRLSDPFKGKRFCEMIVSKDKSRAYLVGEEFRGDHNTCDTLFRLKGLDENRLYTVRETGVTASGAALMGVGLRYPKLSDCGSWIWHIEAK